MNPQLVSCEISQMPNLAALCSTFRCQTSAGCSFRKSLRGCRAAGRLFFLTGHGDIPTSVRAIKAGAEDFLSKPVSKQTLLEAIECACVRHAAIQRSHGQLNSFRSLVSTLTPREREVFALMVRGKLNKQIAFQLGTSERTVKAHRHVVMQKLQVQSFAEVVSIAERAGLLAPPSSAEAKSAS
jgi:FixJ family two-component response regulator